MLGCGLRISGLAGLRRRRVHLDRGVLQVVETRFQVGGSYGSGFKGPKSVAGIREVPTPIDHVLVTGPGPYYAPLAEFDVEAARRDIEAHLLLPLQVARGRREQGSPGRGAALYGRRRWPPHGRGTRVHLGDQLDACREQLRTTLPIRRVVGPADIAALAVHLMTNLMTNTAVTGATIDIDGGQQLVER